jgi:methyl-accepting chemotaxis protein
MKVGPVKLATVRQRLLAGFLALVGLFALAGLVARASLLTMSNVIGETLRSVQEDAQLAARLSGAVTQELAAAARYIQQPDSAIEEEFRRFGQEAHEAQRLMNRNEGQSLEEVALIATIDAALSAIETRYALAHRLVDLGRREEAVRQVSLARELVDSLTADIEKLSMLKTRKVATAAATLRSHVEQRAAWMLAVVAVAVLVGLGVVFGTVNWLAKPLRQLVEQARALSSGNFGVRTDGELPGELRELADAMNSTADSLARVVAVSTATANDVAGSARELASVSEQISASASQMAASMLDVSSGAESQVKQLHAVDEALRAIKVNADEVLAGTAQVTELAGEIGTSARSRRQEIARALGILTAVRATVQDAAREVTALTEATEEIDRFVTSVGRIAEQTDLLALNAAIEAARAGPAGRGFGVVADEVRKLAEQAQKAAEEVVQVTRLVSARVAATSRAMEAGVANVSEIESVSHDIDEALDAITSAAERTQEAARNVAQRAERNAQIVASAAEAVQSIARTAESHAAAAQQVSAATQEQSAACEQMSSASAQLLQGSVQLRELVGALKASV